MGKSGLEALRCPQCEGDVELDKDQEYGFCKYCGTKVQNTNFKVIKGKVKIDNDEFVEKQLINARRAKAKEDWEETEKYYNLVEQNDPSNIEAIFYSSYGKAKQSLIESDLYKRQASFKVLKNCVSIIDDNFDVNKENNKDIILEISKDIFDMAQSSYVYNERKNGYGVVVWTDKIQTITLFNELGLAFMVTLEHIAQSYTETEEKLFYYNLALLHAEYILKNGSLSNPSIIQNIIMGYHKIINELDPSHEVPASAPTAGKRQGGCYVATCVYGSYNCPQVWTLRRFRDYKLAKTWYGRLFIHTYYAISPTIVKLFGETKWFKNMWKGKLDNMVKKLQDEGFESTPYDDIDWK